MGCVSENCPFRIRRAARFRIALASSSGPAVEAVDSSSSAARLFVAVHMQQHRGQLLDLKLAYDKASAGTASAPPA